MNRKRTTKPPVEENPMESPTQDVEPQVIADEPTTPADAKRAITEAALITEIGSSTTTSVYATTALSNAVVTDFLTKRARTPEDFTTALEQLKAIHKVTETSINDKWKALESYS